MWDGGIILRDEGYHHTGTPPIPHQLCVGVTQQQLNLVQYNMQIHSVSTCGGLGNGLVGFQQSLKRTRQVYM